MSEKAPHESVKTLELGFCTIRYGNECLCAGRAAAAGAGRRDGADAKPATKSGGGPREPPGSVRGVRVSQREALPVQGRSHLHLQRGSGLLEPRGCRSSIDSHIQLQALVVDVVTLFSRYKRTSELRSSLVGR